VSYVKDMELHGSLFSDDCSSGAISSIIMLTTQEPLDALTVYRQKGKWILGDLLDGHEFLLILPTSPRVSEH